MRGFFRPAQNPRTALAVCALLLESIHSRRRRVTGEPDMLERLFQLKAHNTNVRTEILAGVTTFLAMAYILFVNPSILGETGDRKSVV